MKKLLLAILSLTFCFCLALTMPFSASANEQNAEIFTETKVQISTNGDKMLVVTGIKDVSLIYQLGYEINGTDYVGVDGDTAETDKYYEGLTLGEVTKSASEMFDGAVGLLVWEIAYDSSLSYDIVPYAYLGEIVDGSFKVPANPEKSYGTEKESFNTFSVTFKNEDGSTISDTSVNYGGKVTEPNAPYKGFYTFDGWYVGETEYNFDSAVTSNLEITAKYVESDTAVYSVDNGNLDGITTALGGVEKSYIDSKYFSNNSLGITVTVPAISVSYETVAVGREAGFSFDLGEIIVDDYKSIKILIQSSVTAGTNATTVYINGNIKADNVYGGAQVFDVIALAKANSVEEITSVELVYPYDNTAVSNFEISLAYIELVKAEKVDVNFVDEDGNPISSTTITAGSTVTAPEMPYKAFYTFDGWYIGEDKFDFTTAINEETTLTAKYVESNTGVYSVANGNILDIVTPLNNGTIETVNSFNFGNVGAKPALKYTYESETTISANHTAGVVFNLGNVNVEDYETIEVTLQATKKNGAGSNAGFVFADTYSSDIASLYGGGQVCDVKASCQAKGVSNFSTLEISLQYWAGNTDYILYVESIVLVKAEKVEEPEVPVGPQSVTYSVANGNLLDITKVLTNGEITTGTHNFANNDEGIAFSSDALIYTYSGEAAKAQHIVGISFDLGEINLADYQSIKIAFQTSTITAGGTNIFCDNTEITTPYGGAHIVDVKALAEAKNITTFSKIEFTTSGWANVTNCVMNVAYIELVVA